MTYYTHKKISNGVGKKIKSIFLSLVTITISVAVIFTIVKAGNLEPPGSPAATMYTLSDIYTRLTTNATSTEGDHLFSPSAEPASSMYTLTQIYNVIPTIVANTVKLGTSYLGVNGTLVPSGGNATTTDVCSGKTFFGANQTDWNLATGALSIDASKILSTATYCGITGNITTQTLSDTTTTVAAGYYNATTLDAVDTDLTTGNIKSGVNLFGIAGTYTYTWTRVATTTQWEGVNENLDWAKEIGGTSWWNNITYSYCTSTACTNNSTTTTDTYTGPPGGWNGSNDYTNFNNSALQNYEVITANGTNLTDCTADAGDLVFPDGSVWDKSASNAYATTVANCDVNDSNATTIWSAADGSGSQYAYARNAPSALSIADAWDGKKNLTTGANNTHSYSQDGINNDYYDRPSQSWYVNTSDGVGTSRLPMIEEYERARQGTSSTTVSLLWGTTNWAQYNWSAGQHPADVTYARVFVPSTGAACSGLVNHQSGRLWVVVAQ